MGLGKVNETRGLFLTIAGGYIWDRKADESNPNFSTQEYSRKDGTVGTRQGAKYADLTGKIVKVQFKVHEEYGENINVTVDSEGDIYILSISTNNRYSQDMMKALLNADLSKDIFIMPYDFIDKDKNRAMGISFRQDGEKLDLRVEDAPMKDKDWFKESSKKNIKRFFEDLTEYFVAEVEERVIPQLVSEYPEENKTEKTQKGPVKSEDESKTDSVSDEKTNSEVANEGEPDIEAGKRVISVLKMKKALKAYSLENYEGRELPKLSKTELVEWYNLSLKEEELPFTDEEAADEPQDVSEKDLDSQLTELMKK